MTIVTDRVLLDTHALVWLVQGEQLRPEAREAIRIAASSEAVFISPISGWEVANLVRKQRLILNRDVEDWFEAAIRIPGLKLTELSSTILIKSAFCRQIRRQTRPTAFSYRPRGETLFG